MALKVKACTDMTDPTVNNSSLLWKDQVIGPTTDDTSGPPSSGLSRPVAQK